MHKSELIGALAKEKGLSRSKAEEVIDLFFDEMTNALANGERVEIRGLLSMFVKEYKAYTGRNPKTKEAVQVPAKKLPFFRCGKELAERVGTFQRNDVKTFYLDTSAINRLLDDPDRSDLRKRLTKHSKTGLGDVHWIIALFSPIDLSLPLRLFFDLAWLIRLPWAGIT